MSKPRDDKYLKDVIKQVAIVRDKMDRATNALVKLADKQRASQLKR